MSECLSTYVYDPYYECFWLDGDKAVRCLQQLLRQTMDLRFNSLYFEWKVTFQQDTFVLYSSAFQQKTFISLLSGYIFTFYVTINQK